MSGSQGWKPRSNPWTITMVVTLAAFMEVLDTTIVNVSLPHIAGSLSVSNDESTWALTTYLVANGIVLTVSGALSRMIGRKRYFIICISVFTLASLGCGIATEFWQLILFRAVQGFFGGGLQPTQQAIILDTFPPEKRGTAFSVTAVATIIAPILGPVVGGYLTDTYSWHWIFLINVPIGALTVFGVLQVVEDPPWVEEEKENSPRFDYVGLGFVVLALGGMELALDRGENYDWLDSAYIRNAALVSALGFVGGAYWLLYARHPIVNLGVFKDRNFAVGCAQIGLMGFVLYGSAVVIPQFAQQQLGYNATWSGLVLAPGAVVLVLLIPVTGKLMQLIPAKYVIAFGGLCLASSLVYSQRLTPNLDYQQLAIIRATQTIGLAFLFVPISTLAYATLPRELNGDATALFSMIRNVAGSIGISLSTAIVADHQQIRNSQLIEHMTPLYEPYNTTLQAIRQALIDMGQAPAQAAQMAMTQMVQMLRAQVAVLAYSDVFSTTAIIALFIVPLAFLFSGVKVQGGGGGH
ncbi:DHA2 family efflux MFS transporter permease subunit [Roseomonas populi]|uniref:DHA2 family efflux MFS transporter permease subunit n=1 Tax=Roseomonas populi TaxID=3121582 RepID=A0ABT1X875_9PROT|nr:DHA2 family efflux MFS transporter permease subunit [Roseomonas pecuniae]MCR0984310.1 DHA2 family efflux MFS transporter permease subunit [Roseomonas pecuniae]